MATDPNKVKLTESQQVEAQQPTYGLERENFAKVHDGQVVNTSATAGVVLAVSDRKVTGATSVTAPGAPTGVSAVAGDGEATVSFTAPTSDGGRPIKGYVVTSTPDDITAYGTESPIVVKGLTNDTEYTFRVAAFNDVGTGTLSSASSPVTPTEPDPEPEPEPDPE